MEPFEKFILSIAELADTATLGHLEYAADKAASVRGLHRTSAATVDSFAECGILEET
jgi:hypothetical protein